MSEPPAPGWPRWPDVGLIAGSLCLTTLAVSLARNLAALAGGASGWLALSLALLGLAAGGLVPVLLPRRFPLEQGGRSQGRASLVLALTLLPTVSVFAHGDAQPLPPAALLLVSGLPFVCGGFVAALALARSRGQSERTCARMLAGASLGCVAAAALLARLSFVAAPSVPPARAGLLATPSGTSRVFPGSPPSLLLLPDLLRDGARTLIIGAGGDRDLLVALAGGAAPVRTVGPDPRVMRAAPEDLEVSSLRPHALPGVERVADGARAFLARDRSSYDVIQVALSPAVPDATGALPPLVEDHLATVEAFTAILERLAPEGVAGFAGALSERHAVRLVAMVRETLEARGVAGAAGCIFVAAAGDFVQVLVRQTPFTPLEVGVLEWRCGELAYAVLASPARLLNNPVSVLLLAPDAAAQLAALPNAVAPATDDRPFFPVMARPRELLRGAAPELPAARPLFGAALAGLALCAVLTLARSRRRAGAGRIWAAATFFAAIGLGFAVVGVGMMARFRLLLDGLGPAPTLVLALFFAAGAAGSLRARLQAGSGRLLRRSCARLTIVLLFTAVLLPALPELLLGAPAWARVASSAAVAGPLGYLLGQPFPVGLSLLVDERRLPWAWSVCATFAALGAMAALPLAASFGYTTTMLVGPAGCIVAGALAEVLG